jgi:hypothetical protein
MQKAVILIHHEGVSGRQRGTTKRLDRLDYSIGLKNLNRGTKDQGAYFQVSFTKKRGIKREEAEPFPMMIKEDIGSGLPWTIGGAVGQNRRPYIIALIGLGMKQRDIGEALGCTEANVSQIKKKAFSEGFFNEVGIPTLEWHKEYRGHTIESVIGEYKDE